MMNAGIYSLFVYGSLRSGFKNPVYEYMTRYFRFIGMAETKGWLVDLGEYPAGVPTEGEHYITGELYEANEPAEFAWAMGQLDDYEGITVEVGEHPLYRRELADIKTDDKIVKAWVYWYNGDISGKTPIPSGDIMDYRPAK